MVDLKCSLSINIKMDAHPLRIFLDNNIFDLSILVADDVSIKNNALLKEDLQAIEIILGLKSEDRIEFYIGPNVLVEDLGRTLVKIQKINKKWGGFIDKCKVLETKNSFILCSYDEQYEKFRDPNERYKGNLRFQKLKKILKDKGQDSANILEAESQNMDYFVTIDYGLINKANNEGRQILNIRLLRPSDLLQKIHTMN